MRAGYKMQAIGVLSGKIYVQGKTKAELCRFLNRHYPSYLNRSSHRKTVRHQILPEPLKLVTDDSNRWSKTSCYLKRIARNRRLNRPN